MLLLMVMEKTTAKMNEQEKVALRYAFVQQQLSNATGDFVQKHQTVGQIKQDY